VLYQDVEISETKKVDGLKGRLNKVVLAYSGGLDTSVVVPWLRYIYDLVLFLFKLSQLNFYLILQYLMSILQRELWL
jgi:predicted PP-loop superfamily ATPase